MMRDMTEGPGQQPPQEPRNSTADGEREVLEGRVIPSRRQPEGAVDPRREFRRPAPEPQAPEPGPAWSPQADAAVQAAPQPTAAQPGQPWAPSQPQQPTLDAPQAAPQAPQQYAQPQPQPQPPAQQQPAQPGPGAYVPPQQAQQAGHGYPQAPAPAPAAEQAPHGGYGYPQQAPPQPQPQAPAPAPAPAPAAGQGPHVPFAGGAVPPRPAAREREVEPVPAPEAATPDWNALAEQQESGQRRRRVLMVTGGIVAVAVIAGGVATAVVMSGKKDDKPTAGPSSSVTTTVSEQPLPPAPTFSSVAPPPPVDPLKYLKDASKDKAPLTPATLFPGKQFVWQGRTYVKTKSDVTTSCATHARQQVAAALTANGCQKLIRATYTNGGLAVTVGVAAFKDEAHAKKVQHVSQYLAPLNGGGVADFCHGVRCQMTSNAVGRYAYFAIAGYKNGKTLAANDTVGKRAASDASDFAFNRLVQRGKDAAAADAAGQ
jgi:hypothetical protein